MYIAFSEKTSDEIVAKYKTENYSVFKEDLGQLIADTSTNSACVVCAMMRASVVLPVPAGPYNKTEESVSPSSPTFVS